MPSQQEAKEFHIHQRGCAMTTAHTTAPTLSDLDLITGFVRNNLPSHRNPEAFHIVKSNIVDRLHTFKSQLRGYLMADEKRQKSAAAERPPQILLKADTITLTIEGEKDGKLRVTSTPSDDAVIVAAGHGGQVS